MVDHVDEPSKNNVWRKNDGRWWERWQVLLPNIMGEVIEERRTNITCKKDNAFINFQAKVIYQLRPTSIFNFINREEMAVHIEVFFTC